MKKLKNRVAPYIEAIQCIYHLQKQCTLETKIRIEPVRRVPVMHTGGWYYTMEGCLFAKCSDGLKQAVRDVYNTFDEETREKLAVTPKTPGGWIERADFWRRHLCRLPRKQYYLAMSCIVGWYARCVKRRKEREPWG